MRSRRLAGIALYCVGVALLSASGALVTSGPHWAQAYLFLILWAGLLLVLDGLNAAVAGRSPLLDEPDELLGMFALSIPWWLCFELLNLRLKNWSYQGLPDYAPLRWGGYALAFGTLLPALAEARELLATALPLKSIEAASFRLTDGIRGVMRFAAFLFLGLALVWPSTYYPLVWFVPFLLIEASLSQLAPLRSSLFELGLGNAETVIGWSASGLLCGVLWQAGNWWAGGRWSYSLPGIEGARIFDMPLFGYAGFIPFALSSAAVVSFSTWLWPRLTAGQRATTVFCLSAFSAMMFAAIDAHTLK